MYSYGPPHMAVQKQDDQHEHTFSSYVRIRDVVLKTYLRRWTIGRSGERGSGISVLPARYDDDDSGTEWIWEQWKWRGSPHSPKLLHFRSLTIRLFRVISKTHVRKVLPLRILQPLLTWPKISDLHWMLHFYGLHVRLILSVNNYMCLLKCKRSLYLA